MPTQFLSISPVLGTLDLSEAIAYYQNTLGFTLDWRQEEPSSFAAVSRAPTASS